MTDLRRLWPSLCPRRGALTGREISSQVGPVFGLIVRSTGAGGNLKGTFKGFKQGEVVEFSASLEEARHLALGRLVEHAQSMGADAVIGLRFDSTDMGATQGMAEILAYGTAVKFDAESSQARRYPGARPPCDRVAAVLPECMQRDRGPVRAILPDIDRADSLLVGVDTTGDPRGECLSDVWGYPAR